MGLLEKNQKNDVRFEISEFVLYEPTREESIELKKIIANKIEITETGVKKGENTDLELWRYILRELTSVGYEIEDMNDEVLLSYLDNGNRKLRSFINAIKSFINELQEETIEEYELNVENAYLAMKIHGSFLNICLRENNIQAIEIKINKLFKKEGFKFTYSDFIKNPDLLSKAITKKAKK